MANFPRGYSRRYEKSSKFPKNLARASFGMTAREVVSKQGFEEGNTMS